MALTEVVSDMEVESTDQSFVKGEIAEEREDVFEENARLWEVRELTKRLVESYLKTGEFGGGGGDSGGESGGFGGIWSVSGGVRRGGIWHSERRER